MLAERIADRTIAFEGDHGDVGGRAVDREEREIDVNSAGELTENEFVWFERRKREKFESLEVAFGGSKVLSGARSTRGCTQVDCKMILRKSLE